MTEEEKKNQTSGVEPPQVSKRDQLNSLLSSVIDGYDPTDDEGSAGMLSDYVQRNIDDKKKFSEAIQKDPRLAQVFSDVVAGKRSAGSALARYFGKDMLTAQEGTPEYDEIMQAEKERMDELESGLAKEKSYKANVEKSLPLLEAKCKEAGVDMNAFLDKVWEQVVFPISEGRYDAVFDVLQKGFSYDNDVKDAMAAGETKGRNTRINQMREERGDGMPKGMSSSTITQQQKKPKRSAFMQAALDA